MARKMLLMLLLMGAFIATVGVFKYRQVQAAIDQASAYQPPPEAVTTIEARRQMWRPTLGAIGTVAAVQGVAVSADLPGIVEAISFTSGQWIRQGERIVSLDTRQEEAQLRAAEARLDLARVSLQRIGGLRGRGVASQAELDAAQAEHDQAEAAVGEIRATIERKTIRAPFSGVLGLRQVNLGQYLNSGDPVVPLQSLDPIYANFSLPQQDLRSVRPGGRVEIRAEGAGGETFEGRISAIDSVVDVATRNVRIQATLANPDGRLRHGMFVKVDVVLEEEAPVVTVPASSISYAPYGDSVFVVEEIQGPGGGTYLGVHQKTVRLGPSRGDQVAVLSGIEAGSQVVTSGVFKLRNGAAVLVNNEIQPSDSVAPQVEEK